MTEEIVKPASIDAQAAANGDTPAASEVKPAQATADPLPGPEDAAKAARKRKRLAAIGVAVLVVLLVFGIPRILEMLNTASTDDAFVNGHVTFVAPRVP